MRPATPRKNSDGSTEFATSLQNNPNINSNPLSIRYENKPGEGEGDKRANSSLFALATESFLPHAIPLAPTVSQTPGQHLPPVEKSSSPLPPAMGSRSQNSVLIAEAVTSFDRGLNPLNQKRLLLLNYLVFVVQFVDVCMFSNGKFKNVVATIDRREESPLGSGTEVTRTFRLNPAKGATKNWIALEDSYNKSAASLASTVVCNSPEERNVFAIYVSYYVKVKLLISAIGGAVSLKLPFTLMHSPFDLDMSLSTPMAQLRLHSALRNTALSAPPSQGIGSDLRPWSSVRPAADEQRGGGEGGGGRRLHDHDEPGPMRVRHQQHAEQVRGPAALQQPHQQDQGPEPQVQAGPQHPPPPQGLLLLQLQGLASPVTLDHRPPTPTHTPYTAPPANALLLIFTLLP
ncbi:unnamed protein product [Bemisia tabaci]|uniref:Arrestin C-terminal-like domain-containing protein n=1 Tax=Bemisia tabaci TaxID=7038 RepID=A0A9P0F6J2_BEMTA|nr:unnamed protein product [Bemisia tabaci]